MALSAVSELSGITTISDNDLLMVSHTTDGGRTYTSNKITYGTLKSAIVGESDQDGSDSDDIAQSLAPYIFYQLGTGVNVTIKPSDTIKVNGLSLVGVGTVNNAIVINGIPCEEPNAYRVGSKGYYYIAYPGDRITDGSTSYQHMTIAPFLNVGGEQLENSDFYYSATLNLKDFYDKFTNNTLSTYSTLFNQLGINTEKTSITTTILNKTLFYKEFTIACNLSERYNVVVTPSLPAKAYKYYIYNETIQKKGLQHLLFQATREMIKFPRTGTATRNHYKMEDINFNITISKLYEDITDTETE